MKASKQFLGEHDFRNFCKLDVVANQNFVRTVFNMSIDEVVDPVQPAAWPIFSGDSRL